MYPEEKANKQTSSSSMKGLPLLSWMWDTTQEIKSDIRMEGKLS